MNREQFERLDQAVNRVVAEHNRKIRRESLPPNLRRPWEQTIWATGQSGPAIDLAGVGIDREIIDNGEISDGGTVRFVNVNCGSGCCLAGDGVIAAGARLLIAAGEDYDRGEGVSVNVDLALYEGQVRYISDLADDLFGLPPDHNLFESDNDADRIVRLATEFAAEDGFTLTATQEDLL